jgi:hypothetical protein
MTSFTMRCGCDFRLATMNSWAGCYLLFSHNLRLDEDLRILSYVCMTYGEFFVL